MKQVKSQATEKWGPPFETARRDLKHGAILSLNHALCKQSLSSLDQVWPQNQPKNTKIVKSQILKKPYETSQIVSYRQKKTTIRNSSTRSETWCYPQLH